MKKIYLLLLMLIAGIGSTWASTYTPGTRATSLTAGKYFIYNTCWVYTNNDWTGFIGSNGTTMTYKHGTKPSAYSTTDPNSYWTLAVIDADNNKYTLRNSDGLYASGDGVLSTTETYIYITPYACSATGACGSDAYSEPADEGTATCPSTTASENSGIFVVGNEDKSLNWKSNGSSFSTYSFGQPMAFYPVTETAGTRYKYTVTKVGDFGYPSTLTIGSYVAFQNVVCSGYVYEGRNDGSTTDANKLFLQSNAPATTTEASYSYAPNIFKVGGSEGAYTFQAASGNYIQALTQSGNCYTGATAETFSLTADETNSCVYIKGASNNQYFNKISAWGDNWDYLVGWYATGGNSKYVISIIDVTAEAESYVNVTYNYQWNGITQYSTVVPTTKDAAYTYVTPTTYYGAVAPTAPTAETKITEDKVVNYNYTANSSVTLPFKATTITGSTFPTDTKWYMLAMRSATKYGKYDGTNVANSTDNSTATVNTAFCFTGNPVAGYQIHNFAAGVDKALTIASAGASGTFTTSGSTLDYTVSATNSYKEFKIRNTTNGYIHDLNSKMGGWYSDSAPEDEGSNITFTEIDEVIYTVAVTGATDVKVTYNSTEYADGATITIATGTAVGLTSSSFGCTTVSGTVNDVTLSGETVTAAYQTALFTEGKPYTLKAHGEDFYIEAVNATSGTVQLATVGTPLYFTYAGNSTWTINTYGDYTSGKYIGVSYWNATMNQTSANAAAWTFESAGDDAGYYMSQSKYTGNAGSGYHYIGVNSGTTHAAGVPLYTDKATGTSGTAIAFDVVETTPFVATTITDGKFASSTKWYRMRLRPGTNRYASSDLIDGYDASGSMQYITTSALYCFVKDADATDGYKIYNYIQGTGKSLYNSGANNEICKYTTAGIVWTLKHNTTNGFQFQSTQANGYMNDVNPKIGVWNPDNSAASTDGGSTIIFEEVSTSDLTTAEALPQPGKFYTFQEKTTSQYLTPILSTVTSYTDRLAMDASATDVNKTWYFTGAHLLGYANGLFPKNGSMLGQAAAGVTGAFFYFKKVSDGVYTICYNNGRALYGAKTGYVDGAGDSNTGDGYKFTTTEVTSLPVTFKSSFLGYATFCSPVATTIEDENTHAYVCKMSGTDLTFYEITNVGGGKNIPANTGVLLYNSTVSSSDVDVTLPTTTCSETITGNSFVGTIAAKSFSSSSTTEDWYSLRVATFSDSSTKVGFYRKTDGTTRAGFKAWLQTEHSASARTFTIHFDGETPTGIVEALGLQNENVDIYDLSGRKLQSYRKGINIVNGKKIIK